MEVLLALCQAILRAAIVHMTRISDRFAEAALQCTSLPDLGDLLGGAAAELGFHFFALLDHASLGTSSAELVRIDNYPEAWVRELVRQSNGMDDPVHLASRRASSGFEWDALPSVVPLGRRHRQILARSREFGIGSGFTVPANVPGEPSASCSFAMRTGCDIPSRRLRCAELIGAHALTAARRLKYRRPLRQRPRLSRREIECLRLVAQGKTDWEIAVILGISVETVHQYVKRARAAYEVVSRTQLVVHALRDAWISFDEAIPQTRSEHNR